MLNLYVMRHSKSSWNDHNINDFERPLSNRGKKDIKLIIAFLKKKKITFDLAYISSSKRTKQTFKILKNNINCKKIIYSKKFYLCSESFILNTIKNIKKKYKNILIVNHEPCCKNLVLKLIRKNKLSFIKKKFSTSAIAKLVFSIENWENLKNYSGNLTLFKTPKDFR
jgi:phosphohistidine phosphatase